MTTGKFKLEKNDAGDRRWNVRREGPVLLKAAARVIAAATLLRHVKQTTSSGVFFLEGAEL